MGSLLGVVGALRHCIPSGSGQYAGAIPLERDEGAGGKIDFPFHLSIFSFQFSVSQTNHTTVS